MKLLMLLLALGIAFTWYFFSVASAFRPKEFASAKSYQLNLYRRGVDVTKIDWVPSPEEREMLLDWSSSLETGWWPDANTYAPVLVISADNYSLNLTSDRVILGTIQASAWNQHSKRSTGELRRFRAFLEGVFKTNSKKERMEYNGIQGEGLLAE